MLTRAPSTCIPKRTCVRRNWPGVGCSEGLIVATSNAGGSDAGVCARRSCDVNAALPLSNSNVTNERRRVRIVLLDVYRMKSFRLDGPVGVYARAIQKLAPTPRVTG